MRLRNVKNAHERLVANERYVITNPNDYKGKWNTVFGNNNPVEIEIGMGKGQFLCELATRNPDVNYIGIEKFTSVILRASERLETLNLPNVRIINIDAAKLLDFFSENEVNRIYLNFSDPWPKKPHAKRRLTHENFLKLYEIILNPEGEIHFKTDNRGLFEFSLESINNYNMLMKNISLDLHNSDYPDNIVTEFEERFSKLGPIYRLEAYFRKD